MSSVPLPDDLLPGTHPVTSTASPAPRRVPAWLREPLLHFVLIGAALFAADRLIAARADDSHVITIGADVDAQIRAAYQAGRGREPNERELAALRQRAVENEVLYRHGLSMRLDRGDQTIRDRVIFKALSLIDADVPKLKPEPAAVRAWFEANRHRYDEPARYDFLEAVLAGTDSSEAAVRTLVAGLNAGTPGEAKAGLNVFKGRPGPSIALSYGDAFLKVLAEGPAGVWRAVPSGSGWRAIRVEAIEPARPASFEAIAERVLQDWRDAKAADLRSAAVAEIAKRYVIRVEGRK